MKLLVTGRNGQLGRALVNVLGEEHEVIALDRSAFDLSRPDTLAPVLQRARPDVILNAAAYTAVDKAEAEPALAETVNATAPSVLAEEARKLGALLIHYSTDYVFDGAKPTPYVEEDIPRPLSVYGRSKLHGEQAVQSTDCAHLILRTSWVYDADARAKNFLLTIARLAHERPELRVVSDQLGAPTSAPMLAGTTAQLLQRWPQQPHSGLYHMTASGHTSWHGFAELIVSLNGPPFPRVLPIPSSDYPTPAQRPLNSRLDCSRLQRDFGLVLAPWEEEARRIMAKYLMARPPTQGAGRAVK